MERLERIYRYEQSCEFLPHRLKSLALSLPDKQKERVEELRLRVMHPLTVLTGEGELNAAPDGIGLARDGGRLGADARRSDGIFPLCLH